MEERALLGGPLQCLCWDHLRDGQLLAEQRGKTAPRGPVAAQCHVETEEQRGVPRRAMEGGERRSGGACEGSPSGEEGRGPGDRWESREEASCPGRTPPPRTSAMRGGGRTGLCWDFTRKKPV